MSVLTVKDRLATIVGAIEGVETASPRLPRGTASVKLPHCIILTGRGEEDHSISDLIYETRQYRLVLLVKPWVQGIDLEAETLCEPFFRRFLDTFAARPGLHTATNADPLTGIQKAVLLEDSGIINVEFSGAGYAGIEFILQIEELVDISQGS